MTRSAPTEAAAALPRPHAGRYLLDPERTTVGFTVRKLGVPIRCRFLGVAGTMHLADEPERSQVDVSVAAGSFSTGNARRDAHVRSADFLDVAAHPRLHFRSTGADHGDGGWRVTGNLTVRGVAQPLTLAVLTGARTGDGTRQAFTARGTLRRSAFGVSGYRFLVGDVVTVRVAGEAVRSC